jgi:16S rRNA (uracil1498-N3)-methyltransferase
MTRRRWIADEVSGRRAVLIGAHADHLIRVLRARVGQEFEISAGSNVYRARIATIAKDRVELELEQPVSASSSPPITLVMAVIKFDRMEWAIEKCTEVGVGRFIPLIASRTDTHLASAAFKRVERWQRIAREASEQSRRSAPPEVEEPLKLKDALCLSPGTRIFLSELERSTIFMPALQAHSAGCELFLAVGPEGGWTEKEAKLFSESGWLSASLGTTILRAETAAIVAAGIAAQLLMKPPAPGIKSD